MFRAERENRSFPNEDMYNKYKIFTWGCQMNEDDSAQIDALLRSRGMTPTDLDWEADVAVLVTCSVREKPENKAKSKLGELKIIKESRPHMIIGVCGCMAQREGKRLRRGRPYIDFVIGTAGIGELPVVLDRIEGERGFKTVLDLPTDAGGELPLPARVPNPNPALKEFVPIMYGCNNFCAYCVVPYVRGRERSRRPEDIIDEIKYLASKGTKEVTLLGQNVNSYGATADFDTDFADLLSMVNEVEGIERIRFTTSHPKDLSDRVIRAMAELPKVCEHIHLAVQSGDDVTLRAMNRGYTADRLRERIGALRAAVKDVAVTTDFLIGFPGETEEGLERTLAFAEEIRFDGAFMFSYNIIPGTAAEKMTGHMTMPEKNRRLERLIEIQNRITCEINESRVGDVFEVLVDGASKDGNMVSGFTRQNKIVNFPGSRDLIGRLVKVKITEGRLFGFMGEMI